MVLKTIASIFHKLGKPNSAVCNNILQHNDGYVSYFFPNVDLKIF